jgi:hypothetical protein
MKRRILLVNLVLLGLTVAAAARLRWQWRDARAREQAVLRQRIKPRPAPPVPPAPAAESVKAAFYFDIAQKMLFSKDRNPTVVVVAPPPPPPKRQPPLPLFHGMVDLGDGPMAIMSEKPGGQHRDFRPGEQIGEYKLVAVDRQEITLEWDGQNITKNVDEMLDRSAPPPSQAAPASAANAAAAAPRPVQPQPRGEAKPAAADLGGIRACQTGDTSPSGTVADGMRKVIKKTPFGQRCYWEAAN